jgi:hypothetical protein
VNAETMSKPTSPTAHVSVPHHVVYRSFPTETVVLNLETGRYHGLNPPAGRMLEALERAASPRAAAAALARDYDQSRSAIERDLCGLCGVLADRGLVEIDDG